jgi:hypothetical protein
MGGLKGVVKKKKIQIPPAGRVALGIIAILALAIYHTSLRLKIIKHPAMIQERPASGLSTY